MREGVRGGERTGVGGGGQCCSRLQLAVASIRDVRTLSHLVRNSTTASPRNSSLSL